jgi:glycosyltransferase involved in cell wall biosynthesis
MGRHIVTGKPQVPPAQLPDLAPVRIVEIEVGQPLPDVLALDEKTGRHYQRALCLVRLHTQPLGLVELQLDERGASPQECALQIWRTLSEKINEHLRRDGLPAVTGIDAMGLSDPTTPACLEEREQFFAHAPFVSVIIPTRDRPQQIQRCLQLLMALHYPQYEIIVVDNAPSTSATADFIRQTYDDIPRVRYVREDRPGRSLALNSGMMAARGEVLAFIDDDVEIDRYWLVELVRGFSCADGVACVTGLVLPLELETPPQFWLEEWGGFCKGFAQHLFDMGENHPRTPLHPYTAGHFGTGASMAFRAAFLRSVGGFDPALGTGSPAQGGEDLAIFFQVITRGYKLVYEPAAVVYHPHYHDYKVLRKQMYRNGVGLTAYLTKILLDNPRLLFDFVPRLPYGLVFTLSPRSSKNNKKSPHYPRELTTLELKGMLYGPFAYLYSRWTMRNARKAFAPVEAMRVSTSAEEASALGHHMHEREDRVYS